MRLFLEKLQCNKKYEAFLRKRWLNRHFASSILFGLMLLLGNSCAEECAKPTTNVGTFTLTVPAIPPSSGCYYNPNLLNRESDLVQGLDEDGWVAEILVGGKCSGDGVWNQMYKKSDFSFLKKNDGKLQFSMPNIPYDKELSLKLVLHSNCNDNSNGHCAFAGFSTYRATLSSGFDKIIVTEQSKSRELPILTEGKVIAGADSGCR
jgi:hypothetical protein